MRSRPKVLALFDAVRPTTLDQDLSAELATEDWQTEANVLEALRSLGCPTEHLAIFDDTDLIRQKVERAQPEVIFNLADQFKNNRAFDQNIASFLELQGIPFTGCGATGLTLCKHKGISKKILSYHRIRVPEFTMVRRGSRTARPKPLRFPLLVKPLKEEASLGIAQASLVHSDDEFRERVSFIHEKYDQDAIAEEYIEGRELYVSVLGNHRLEVFPIRELRFGQVPAEEPKIATYKAKWDAAYRQRWGIRSEFAEDLDPALARRIQTLGRRIYHLLAIDGYARLDLRLTADGQVVFIEANPNPILAAEEDFAQSAGRAGYRYARLIGRILKLGLTAVRD
jgi:D-alanine-D-alanine ligase